MKFKGLNIGDLVKVITQVDVYVGYVKEIDIDTKILWISQTGSLVGGLYFNFYEIMKVNKLESK